jgi:phage shock protein A
MWNRLKMVFRSLFGWMIRGMENPELVLRQLMDDMRQKLPELNVKAAEVIKYEKQLGMQIQRSEQKIADYQAQQAKAAELGKQEAFMGISRELKTEQAKLVELQSSLEAATKASATARRARDHYKREMDRKINEAMRQLARHKQAQMKQEIAGLLSSFEVGDQDDTLERMTARIDEDLARADARLELASDSYEGEMMDLEADAEEAAAAREYIEMRRQMGLEPPEEVAQRTLEPIEETVAETPPTETEQNP